MKTSRLLLLAALLAGSASLLTAGPGPQYWIRPAAPKPAPAAVAPAASNHAVATTASCTTCACCKKA